MKLAKSLLLGSAAALATVAGAQAADLPVRKAAPVAVEYVRVCSTYGAGFFVIPGTDSCIKLGGRVRMDAVIQTRFNRSQDYFGYRARGRMSFDVRTPTPYGLLRTFVRFQITNDSGSTVNGGSQRIGDPTQKPLLDEAFIQFGGLTAGRAVSFFSNTSISNQQMGTLRFDDAPDIALFGYTFSLGNGFSISASAEDPWARRLLTNNQTLLGLQGRTTGGNFDPNGGAFIGNPFFPNGLRGINAEGFRYPDVVANIKYEGTWGAAQISGAVHEIASAGFAPGGARRGVETNFNTNPFFPNGVNRDDDVGFAVQGSVELKLPMITAGDAAFAEVVYSDGAIAYNLGGSNGQNTVNSTVGFDGNNPGFISLSNNTGIPISDAFINRRGNIETTQALSVAAGFRHFWVPNILRSNIFGSWLHVDVPGASARSIGGNAVIGLSDFDEWRVGGNLFWSPLGPSDLNIGVEIMYKRFDFDNRVLIGRSTFGATAGNARFTDNEDAFEGRVRVQRDF